MHRSTGPEWLDPEDLLERDEAARSPEQNLWLAVIHTAILDAFGKCVNSPSRQRGILTLEARRYVRTVNFLKACEHACLDGSVIQSRVLELLSQEGAGIEMPSLAKRGTNGSRRRRSLKLPCSGKDIRSGAGVVEQDSCILESCTERPIPPELPHPISCLP